MPGRAAPAVPAIAARWASSRSAARWQPPPPPSLPAKLVSRRSDERFGHAQELIGARAADPSPANRSMMIHQVQRWISHDFPVPADCLRALGSIAKRSPRDPVPSDSIPCLFGFAVTIHADDVERLILEVGGQLLFVRDQLHARKTPRGPEVQEHGAGRDTRSASSPFRPDRFP